MKTETLFAIILSVIVIVISTFVILALEPSNKTVPYLHDKTIQEIEDHLLSMKVNKDSNEPLFSDLKEIDEDTLKYIMGIEPEYLEEYSVMTSTESATTFLVLKPKEGGKSLVESNVLEYMDFLEKKWEDMDKEQAELVQNYAKVSYSDYLIYVVSNNNEYFKTDIESFFIYADR